MKRFKKISSTILAASLLLVMAMGLASCASSKSDNYNLDVAYETTFAGNKGANNYEYTDSEVAEDFDYSNDGAYSDASNSASNTSNKINTNSSQKLIRKMNLRAETKDFNGSVSAIKNKVSELGGYMDQAEISGTGKNKNLRTAYFVIRVPAENLDTLVNSVSSGIVILSSSETTTDVTLQYSDIESHIKALRTEQATLFELLAKSDSLENTIVLQQRLSEVQYEIESYESSLKVMANQVSYSTLTLTVDEVLEETEIVETKKLTFGEEALERIKGSLENIGEDSRMFALLFIAALPYLAIVGIIAAIIVLIVKLSIKASKKKAAKKAAKKVKVETKDVTPSEEKK